MIDTCNCNSNCTVFKANTVTGAKILTPCDDNACIHEDLPWLKPCPFAVGRTYIPDYDMPFRVAADELDNGSLPGRPPHTIVCVRTTGVTKVSVVDTTQNDYDLILCVLLPVEVTIRDCCGFTYCVHSEISTRVAIPMPCKILKSAFPNVMAYVKSKICLSDAPGSQAPSCDPGTITTGITLPAEKVALTVEIVIVHLKPYATARKMC